MERRVPWLSERVELCEEEPSGSESFTLRSDAGKLCIAATSANAAAVGVNWYLNHYCGRSMSHMGDNLGPVDDLPLPEAPVKVTTDLDYRYALNYCTFNYSMSFYTWEDWERELDWMALHGVNLMLVANGAEAVWQNTLRRLGYSEKRIASFLSGPAYNAWWLMGNLEGWGGPMPQSQIDART
ncbi:alpha-N-acetylglucosaminidase, partial [human gut metagenome]